MAANNKMETSKELEQIPKMSLSSEEYLDVLLKLQNHHAVFYKMWELGNINFTDNIPTAAISFDDCGEFVDFKFNPEFWDELNDYQKLFIISHECTHIILNHGFRLINTQILNNIAADIVNNTILINSFGFEREKLGFLDKNLCFVDTVFGENYKQQGISENGSMEYYINKLKENAEAISIGLSSIDDHNTLPGKSGKDGGEQKEDKASGLDRFFDKLGESLSNEEKQSLKKAIGKHDEGTKPGGKQAGKGTGKWYSIAIGKAKVKKKWETVIKKWSRKYDKQDFRDIEQWSRTNRRFATLNGSLMLPTEMEQEYDTEGKINVFFFQDTSGSCWHLKDRFFKAARSLSKDRFNIRMFCFDTIVVEIDIDKNKIYGGGGTSFGIIENKIQEVMKNEGTKYPEAVFIITDGYGSNVNPQDPKKWYWFLSESYEFYIPKESNKYMLSDYE